MSNLTAIRQALAQNIINTYALITNMDTLLGAGVQILRGPIGDPTPPCIYVVRETTPYDTTLQRFGVTYEPTFTVRALVALTSDLYAQDMLDMFVDPSSPLSVKRAIEIVDQPPNITLGGLVEDLRVTEAGQDQVFQRAVATAIQEFIGVDFTVEVYV